MNISTKYILKNFKSKTEYFIAEDNVRSFIIIEDLELPYLSAQLDINDAGGWFEQLPLTGNEGFEVEIIQEIESLKEGEEKKKINITKIFQFEIYDYSLIPHENGKGSVVSFILAERGFLDYISKSFSKSFKDTKISDIVKTIFTEHLKLGHDDFKIENTSTKIDFIIPFWKSPTTLKYLKKIAERADAPQEAGYVFYSSTGESTQKTPVKLFVSLASLLKQKPSVAPKDIFYFKNYSIPYYYMNNILDITNEEVFNKYTVMNGIRGKTYYGINLHNNKKILTVSQGISEFVKDKIFLGKDTHFEENSDDKTNDVQFKGFYNESLIKTEMNHNFRINFESINTRKIVCNGVLDRYVGKTIYITETSSNPSLVINAMYSGVWLIKKIVHCIRGPVFQQKMTIVKDSYDNLSSDVPVKHIKPNNSNIGKNA